MLLHVRFHRTPAAQRPAVAFCRKVQVIHEIIAVVHQVSIKSSRGNGLHILRHVGQEHVQHIISPDFRSSIRNRFFFFHLFFLFHLRSRRLLGRFQRNIIVICLNHHTFFNQHGDFKPVLPFYQCHIFSLKATDNPAAHFAQETYFISYFHIFTLIL